MLGCSVVLGNDAMHAWGWRLPRLPFLVAAPLGLISLYLRSKMEDTPVFRECAEEAEHEQHTGVPIGELFVSYWRPLLQLGGLVVALNVVNYVLLYMPTFMKKELGMSDNLSLLSADRHAVDDGAAAVRGPRCRIVSGARRCGGGRWWAFSSLLCRCSR